MLVGVEEELVLVTLLVALLMALAVEQLVPQLYFVLFRAKTDHPKASRRC